MNEKHKALDVCNRWELTASEIGALLGVVKAGNNAQFDQNGAVNIDDYSAERLAYCVLIDQWLVSLFKDPSRRHRWLRAPNTAFQNKSALEVMMNGRDEGFVLVNDYLKAVIYA